MAAGAAKGPLARPARARLLVFACATADSGVPDGWAAQSERSGVHLLDDLSERSADALLHQVRSQARPGDLVVLSIHWGGNWGYRASGAERAFAHRMVDSGEVHAVHGHSSHHPRGIEVRDGRLILYGCGDLVNDYEGIEGHESFRPDLALMYFPRFELPGGAAGGDVAVAGAQAPLPAGARVRQRRLLAR